MKRDDCLEAIDCLDQLGHAFVMATRGTAHEALAREVGDRIGRLNQRVGKDGLAALIEIVGEAEVSKPPPRP